VVRRPGKLFRDDDPHPGVRGGEDRAGDESSDERQIEICLIFKLTHYDRFDFFLQVMKLPPGLELYRGLGGTMELPDSYFQV
jgi:hypothetical protein